MGVVIDEREVTAAADREITRLVAILFLSVRQRPGPAQLVPAHEKHAVGQLHDLDLGRGLVADQRDDERHQNRHDDLGCTPHASVRPGGSAALAGCDVWSARRSVWSTRQRGLSSRRWLKN